MCEVGWWLGLQARIHHRGLLQVHALHLPTERDGVEYCGWWLMLMLMLMLMLELELLLELLLQVLSLLWRLGLPPTIWCRHRVCGDGVVVGGGRRGAMHRNGIGAAVWKNVTVLQVVYRCRAHHAEIRGMPHHSAIHQMRGEARDVDPDGWMQQRMVMVLLKRWHATDVRGLLNVVVCHRLQVVAHSGKGCESFHLVIESGLGRGRTEGIRGVCSSGCRCRGRLTRRRTRHDLIFHANGTRERQTIRPGVTIGLSDLEIPFALRCVRFDGEWQRWVFHVAANATEVVVVDERLVGCDAVQLSAGNRHTFVRSWRGLNARRGGVGMCGRRRHTG